MDFCGICAWLGCGLFVDKLHNNPKPILPKVMQMRMLKFKRAIVTHPGFLFFFALVLGLVLAYVWVHYIDLVNPYCSVPKP
jgi:hypothetical protein